MSLAVRVHRAVTSRPSRVRMPPLIIICCVVAAGMLVLAVFGSLLTPDNPMTQNMTIALAGPSRAHWLGTDLLGRDVLSRVIAGARTALVGPLVISLGSFLAGNWLGLIAGYREGWLSSTIMRWVDLMWSLPDLLVIIVVEGTFHGGYWLAVALLLVLWIPFDTRIIRGATLEQAHQPYVESARVLGVPDWQIMLSHIWPNVAPAAVANTCLVFVGSLVSISSLSFLGLGVTPGTPDWGWMLSEGLPQLFVNPIAALAPGVMIILAAVSVNLIGDWCYEQLSTRGDAR
jgi:peptide/nickel transport system permease protein